MEALNSAGQEGLAPEGSWSAKPWWYRISVMMGTGVTRWIGNP